MKCMLGEEEPSLITKLHQYVQKAKKYQNDQSTFGTLRPTASKWRDGIGRGIPNESEYVS